MNALPIDVVSDVVCPWCYIGKRRLEKAIAMLTDVMVTEAVTAQSVSKVR